VAGFGAWRMRIAEYYNRSEEDGCSAVASMFGGSLDSCAVEFDGDLSAGSMVG
jgi:hypothetical protein